MTADRKGARRTAGAFLKEAILLLPRLVQLLYRLMKDPRVRTRDKLLVMAAIAYVASPIDIVPDFIPFFGQIDDLLAVSLVLLRLIDNSGEDVIREHWTGAEDLIPWIHKTSRFSRIFLSRRASRAVSARFK